ncbi:unnamed protein product [Rangifer tarandus platyrhynchus]|uniref:Uncharacterized protein n=2 Tax=Rangifer tarandus platyrhynchus TaxID=3082113 RepID=A0ABN8Z9R7_RANTA|nr:unnamed protein product [Rangifer tarandus platyrhynchus]CAI9704084.1 unnamed protein product [Rangifer tarandus platyrhynchus]
MCRSPRGPLRTEAGSACSLGAEGGLRCSFQGEAAWVEAVEGREPSWGLSLPGAEMPSTSAREKARSSLFRPAQAAEGSDRAEEGQGHSGPERPPGTEGIGAGLKPARGPRSL